MQSLTTTPIEIVLTNNLMTLLFVYQSNYRESYRYRSNQQLNIEGHNIFTSSIRSRSIAIYSLY